MEWINLYACDDYLLDTVWKFMAHLEQPPDGIAAPETAQC